MRERGNRTLEADPRRERTLPGVRREPPQPWPGLERAMRHPPDHGEETYRGTGKLVGRRALVTGGDSGIGRAVAIAFAREGADVAISYYDEHEDAQETLGWIRREERRSLAIQGDLSRPAHCREVVSQVVSEFGGLDLLVNNAGRQTMRERLEDLPPEQLETTFQTNFFAMVYLCQAALEHMAPGSVILNTGSVTALRGSRHLVDYAATKAAIHNFTKSLADQLAERGIRVNAVAPGPVWTPLIVSTNDAEAIEQFGRHSAWHRPAQPAEIAPSYVFLASDEARYYTGEVLAPTGGETTR